MYSSLIIILSIILTIISLIVTILSYVYIYLDAKQKNEEPILWLIIALFSGIIGVIVYVISQRKKTYENINPKYFQYLKFSIYYYIAEIIFGIWCFTAILAY